MARTSIPRIRVGLLLYVPTETTNIPHREGLYGEVTRIEKDLVYVKRVTKPPDDEVFFLRDSLKKKMRNGMFVVKE